MINFIYNSTLYLIHNLVYLPLYYLIYTPLYYLIITPINYLSSLLWSLFSTQKTIENPISNDFQSKDLDKNFSLSLEEQETIASSILYEPFFGKTVSGFATIKAWEEVINSVTEGPKANFRRKRSNTNYNDARYVVRLGKNGRYEVHDNKDKSQSLFKSIKEQLPPGRVLPPHQSTTYYEPKTNNFNPKSFRPIFGTSEVIGLRFDAKTALINRIILKDRSTARRFYAFDSENEALSYCNKINTKDRLWPKNLSDLVKYQDNSTYNECMTRLSWRCRDLTSQVTIYEDNPRSRIMAILRAKEIQNKLESNPDLYSQEPYYWFKGYQVPISFWGNGECNNKLQNGSLKLYTRKMQKDDLKLHNDLVLKLARESKSISKILEFYFLIKEFSSIEIFDVFIKDYLRKNIHDYNFCYEIAELVHKNINKIEKKGSNFLDIDIIKQILDKHIDHCQNRINHENLIKTGNVGKWLVTAGIVMTMMIRANRFQLDWLYLFGVAYFMPSTYLLLGYTIKELKRFSDDNFSHRIIEEFTAKLASPDSSGSTLENNPLRNNELDAWSKDGLSGKDDLAEFRICKKLCVSVNNN